jgi:glycosyltransferase involved in cell wall biosynthesis
MRAHLPQPSPGARRTWNGCGNLGVWEDNKFRKTSRGSGWLRKCTKFTGPAFKAVPAGVQFLKSHPHGMTRESCKEPPKNADKPAMNQYPEHIPRPLRIAFLDHTAKLGGAELSLLNMLEKIDRTRFAPTVILGESGPLERRLALAGVETCILPLGTEVAELKKDGLGSRSLLNLKVIWKTLRYAWRVSRVIKARNIQLLHTNSLKADIIGGLCAWATGTPLVWHIHDRLEGDYLPRPVASMLRFLCQWVPDFIVANSRSTLASLRLSDPKMSAVVFEGIPASPQASNLEMPFAGQGAKGCSTPRVAPDAHERENSVLSDAIHEKLVNVGIIGRLTRWKGQHILIGAASAVHRRFPNARFQIIGSPMFGENEYEAQLRQQVRDLGLEGCVEFLGFCEDIASTIHSLDIVVHASILEEPFGRVVTEGMLGAKPVVATRGGGVPEIVIDEITGLLVPMGDVVGMADAVCRLLADPALRSRMGNAGKQRALEHFTTEQTVPQMEAVFERTCASMMRKKSLNR